MRIGLIVEGPSDKEALPTLIRRLRADIEWILPIDCGGVGKGKLKSKFVGFLKGFQWHQGPIDKALVVRDSDCRDAGELDSELEGILLSSGFKPSFPVHFFAIKCELETWLVADEQAVTRVATRRGKSKHAQQVKVNLETHANPHDLLLRLLSSVGLPADDQVFKEIAEETDLKVLAIRCPYFTQFAARVHSC
jgi:hypothetical protein